MHGRAILQDKSEEVEKDEKARAAEAAVKEGKEDDDEEAAVQAAKEGADKESAIHQVSAGDTVRCRDGKDDEWLTGTVVSTGPLIVATADYEDVEWAQVKSKDADDEDDYEDDDEDEDEKD